MVLASSEPTTVTINQCVGRGTWEKSGKSDQSRIWIAFGFCCPRGCYHASLLQITVSNHKAVGDYWVLGVTPENKTTQCTTTFARVRDGNQPSGLLDTCFGCRTWEQPSRRIAAEGIVPQCISASFGETAMLYGCHRKSRVPVKVPKKSLLQSCLSTTL
jgi:hypothetical protein